MLTALVVFSIIIIGWAALLAGKRHLASIAPLPSAGGQQGECVLWFVGSSTIHRWSSLEHDMLPWIAQNRGVNDAVIPDITPRLAHEDIPVMPQAIILYAGENDIAKGATPQEALANLAKLLRTKDQKLGATPTFVISIKPGPTRWKDRKLQEIYNEGAAAMADHRKNLFYINARPRLLIDGRPGPFYVEDGIHLNAAGYQILTRLVNAEVARVLPSSVVNRCAPRNAPGSGGALH